MTLLKKFMHKYLTIDNSLVSSLFGECFGTFMLCIFGLGVIVQTDMTGGAFISISFGWGLAVMMGVFWSGKLGHGHINPAVTLAFACVGKLKWLRVPLYWIAQVIGAFFGALVIFGIYYEKLAMEAIEKNNGTFIVEGTGRYFITLPTISHAGAFFDQFFGTFLLSSCALVIVDENGFNLPDYLHPIFLGIMVTTIVGCFAINAGAALNPARDLGPRIMLAVTKWGWSAFSVKNYYFWIPIIAPITGAIAGAIFYNVAVGVHLFSKKSIDIYGFSPISVEEKELKENKKGENYKFDQESEMKEGIKLENDKFDQPSIVQHRLEVKGYEVNV